MMRSLIGERMDTIYRQGIPLNKAIRGQGFLSVEINIQGLQIPCADIFVAQLSSELFISMTHSHPNVICKTFSVTIQNIANIARLGIMIQDE